MRLRARCGARRSGSRRVFRASVGGGVVASFSVVGSRALVVSRGSLAAPLSAPWWRRWSGRRWPLARVGGGCGPRRGRSRRRWSSPGFPRLLPRRPSRRPGPVGSGFRWRFGGSLAGCGVSPCRWPSRRCSGWPLPPRCPPCRSGRGRLRSLGFSALARRGCRRAPVAGRQRRGLPLARGVLVTAPVLLPAIQTGAPQHSPG